LKACQHIQKKDGTLPAQAALSLDYIEEVDQKHMTSHRLKYIIVENGQKTLSVGGWSHIAYNE